MNAQLRRRSATTRPASGARRTPYRTEGWEFLLAGGGLYNNLDYSFTVGHEDGTFEYPPTQPGGGGATMRRQLGVLRRFIDGFDLVRLRPRPNWSRAACRTAARSRCWRRARAFGVYLRRQRSPAAFSAGGGLLVPPASGTYQLHVTSNDGVRVRRAAACCSRTGRPRHEDGHGVGECDGGREQTVSAEYFYSGGAGVMRLEWTRPDGVRETVPAEVWRGRADGGERALARADYFEAWI